MKQKYLVYFIKSMKRDKSGFTGTIKRPMILGEDLYWKNQVM